MMNFCLILAASLLSTHITYTLRHRWNFSPTRASAIPTLVFVALTAFWPFALAARLQAAFFGASFVGMSDSSKLCEKKVLWAGAVFSLIFWALSLHPLLPKGTIGGTLGASAFIACLVVYAIRLRGLKRQSG